MTKPPYFLIDGQKIIMDYFETDGHEFCQPVLVYAAPFQDENGMGEIKMSVMQMIVDQLIRFSSYPRLTFTYYITSESKPFHECEDQMLRVSFGDVQAAWYHHYSDLTGYLWTDTKFSAKTKKSKEEHNLDKEFSTQIKAIDGQAYLSMEIRAF